MAYKRLVDFVERLADAGELARVEVEVDPQEEIAEITRRAAQSGGPALLFVKVRGCRWPLVTNLLGTAARVSRALGLEQLDDLVTRLGEHLSGDQPQGWLARLGLRGAAVPRTASRPKLVSTAPCQQVVQLGSDVDLGTYPAVSAATQESGRAVCGAVVIVPQESDDDFRTAVADIQVVGPRELVVEIAPHGPLSSYIERVRSEGSSAAVALAVGLPPAHFLAAHTAAHLDAEMSDLLALFGSEPVELVRARTQPVSVPAAAEVVIEGLLHPEIEGSEAVRIADAGGFVRDIEHTARIEVTAVSHRSSPLFHTVVPGPPPDERMAWAEVSSRLLRATAIEGIDGLVDLHLPWGLVGHRLAIVALRKAFPLHARQVASAVWGCRPLRALKTLVVVDAEVPLRDWNQVMYQVAAQVDPMSDVWIESGPADLADHALANSPRGGRMVIDATAKWAGERRQAFPPAVAASAEIVDAVRARWAEYGLPGIEFDK